MSEPRIVPEARALLEMGARMVDAGTVRGLLEELDRMNERVNDYRADAYNADVDGMRERHRKLQWKRLAKRLRQHHQNALHALGESIERCKRLEDELRGLEE